MTDQRIADSSILLSDRGRAASPASELPRQEDRGQLLTDMKSLLGKSAIYGLGTILLRAISFLLLPVYTRFLTTSDYGILAVTGMLASILACILPLGLHGALNPIYFFTPDTNQRRADLGTVWLAIVVLAGGMTLLLDLTGEHLFPLLFRSVPFTPYVRLVIWSAFFGTFSLVPLCLFQIQGRAKAYVLSTMSGSLLSIGLVVYFVVLRGQGVRGNLLGSLLAALIMAGVYVAAALGSLRPAFQWDALKRSLVYGLPLVPHSLASWMLNVSDRAVLERFVSLDQLGLYSLAYTYGSIMEMIAYAANSAWVPFLFKTDSVEGQAARHRLAALGTYFSLCLCFMALSLGLFAREILSLMTAPAFHAAAEIAPWIVAGALLSGLYYFPINFVFLRKKTSLVPLVTVCSGILNVALNLWLVPRYGILAAAWTTFISYGAMLTLAWWLGLRVYSLPYEYGRLAKIAAVTGALWLAGGMLPCASLYGRIAGKSLVLVAFPVLLLAVRFFTPTEKRRALFSAKWAWSAARCRLSGPED